MKINDVQLSFHCSDGINNNNNNNNDKHVSPSQPGPAQTKGANFVCGVGRGAIPNRFFVVVPDKTVSIGMLLSSDQNAALSFVLCKDASGVIV